ncbi:flavin reductase [Streptomyces sp. NA04227]|uniref:flavin reductase family protein n=1 Tax=Streptomyces sp. NA04227 TaxID=2742136 RepID=UPI00158FE824|nr:flavin reductase family protein [Streptomyces sp. NA04227]QKW09057.1 flavin reductase [Streptomyces sp. NA04227]
MIEASEVTTESFRRLMGSFPSGVSVVTTMTDGLPSGFTCTSLCSVSLSPPMLLVCANTSGKTADHIVERGRFAVNLLHHDARGTAELFASKHDDRFDKVRWTTTPHGLPVLLDDILAFGECRVTDTVKMGDHLVIFGEVENVAVGDTHSHPPLLYGLRQFTSWERAVKDQVAL